MRALNLLKTILIVGLLSGCVTAGPDIGPGMLFSSIQGPVTATTATGGKKGQACGSTILGLIATGDNSIEAAKKDAGIKVVASVDYSLFNVLGFYVKKCVFVTGSAGKTKED